MVTDWFSSMATRALAGAASWTSVLRSCRDAGNHQNAHGFGGEGLQFNNIRGRLNLVYNLFFLQHSMTMGWFVCNCVEVMLDQENQTPESCESFELERLSTFNSGDPGRALPYTAVMPGPRSSGATNLGFCRAGDVLQHGTCLHHSSRHLCLGGGSECMVGSCDNASLNVLLWFACGTVWLLAMN